MKIFIMSILFLILLTPLFADKEVEIERIYIFKVIAFYQRYEFYCTKKTNGYYKYPQEVSGKTIYLTYEANIFYKQSMLDENFTLFPELYPSYLWSNSRGEVVRMKKRYTPVIEKNRERKGYPYGFGKN